MSSSLRFKMYDYREINYCDLEKCSLWRGLLYYVPLSEGPLQRFYCSTFILGGVYSAYANSVNSILCISKLSIQYTLHVLTQ